MLRKTILILVSVLISLAYAKTYVPAVSWGSLL